MLVKYRANNSGGSDWLDDQDWVELEYNGWSVAWPGDRTLPNRAYISVNSVDEAVNSFEEITGRSASEKGCPCCGPPHNFSEEYEW